MIEVRRFTCIESSSFGIQVSLSTRHRLVPLLLAYIMLARSSGVVVKIMQQCNTIQCLIGGTSHHHRYLKERYSRMQAGNGQACSPLSEHCQRRCSRVYIRIRTLSKKMLDSEHPCPDMVRAARQCTAVCEHGQSCSSLYSRLRTWSKLLGGIQQ